jgi:hypothetical protein
LDVRSDEDAWTSRTRTPAFYPDAVTLVPDCSVPELLPRVDTSPGCSIKDSFASLDLAPYGFRVLFDAEWMARAPTTSQPVAAGARWATIREPDAFAAWERAWRGDDGPPGVLLPDLVSQSRVEVIAARVGDRVVAGALLNGSSEIVGISNFFADPGGASSSWLGCIAFAASLHPGATFVCYGSGAALDAARALGFEAVGPLRVWLLAGEQGS